MSRLVRFSALNLRSVAEVSLADLASFNVLVGRNGAGKTSVLEGIHFLGTGRSFRSRQLASVVRRGEGVLQVTGEVAREGGGGVASVFMGVERAEGSLRMRVGGAAVAQTSVLALALPLLVIRPESHAVFSGGSEERRRVLDWAVFHVEPGFASAHARYRRVLKQRNAGLRQGLSNRALAAWDFEFLDSALKVHEARSSFFERWLGTLSTLTHRLTGLEVSFRYRQGWQAGGDLAVLLASGVASDRERGTTQRGPHRADIFLEVAGGDARSALSRGEGKRLVLALLLGLSSAVVHCSGKRPILLVDDLASELDADARAGFLDEVAVLGCQCFITAVESSLIAERHLEGAAVFHVEQGVVERML